jgi:hypothetical protein
MVFNQGHAGVLKRTTNWGPGPVTDWSGVLLIKHETFRSLIDLFSKNLLGGGGGSKKIPDILFFSNFQINVPYVICYIFR